MAKAAQVLGSLEAAEAWLLIPAVGLDGQRPADLLATPAGAKAVEEHLDEIERDGDKP
nr:MbcA/ParS/Xre antitoxin family protein [Azospirillum soli]